MRANIASDELVMRLRRMMRVGSKHAVVNVRFSRFAFIRNNPRLLLLQINGVKDLADHYGVEFYVIGNTDPLVIFDEKDATLALEVADRITANILPDREERDADEEAVAHVFMVPRDYADLRQQVDNYQVQERLEASEAAAAAAPVAVVGPLEGPLTPALVGQLHALLDNSDVKPHVRAQTVFHTADGKSWEPVYAEVFTSMADLRKDLFPKVHLRGRRNLFQELCQRLDGHVLSAVNGRGFQLSVKQIGLNVGMETLTGPEFAPFLKTWSTRGLPLPLLEINVNALMEDIGVSVKALAAAKERGLEVVVDGIGIDMFPFFNPDRFPARFYKVLATREHLPLLGQNEYVSALRRLGPGVVFCRCDHPTIVSIGRAVGVDKFQGWLLDKQMGTPLDTRAVANAR
jgi:EAL domain-containing protein (putative c-di-GMP-specific phosphodiesterase class I)